MKKTTNQKLRAYASLAGGALLATQANADIIYTDVNPDSIMAGNNNATSEFFYIDLDNDATNDFQIGMWNGVAATYTWQGVWATGVNTSSMASGQNGLAYSSVSNGYYLAQALSSGQNIGGSISFNNYNVLGILSNWSTTGGSTGGIGSIGNFANQGQPFLGLKLYKNGDVHYGWVRVAVDSANYGFTLMDYAYQDCPNFPISAGQMSGTSYLNSDTIPLNVCDSVTFGSVLYDSTGIAYDSVSMGTNCDSIYIYDLTINYTMSNSDTITINQGDSILLGGGYQTVAGTYTDVFSDSSKCDSVVSTTLIVNQIDGIEKDNSNGIKVFPNPSTSDFNLVLSNTSSDVLSYLIIDNVGRVIDKAENIRKENLKSISVEQSGIYFIRIETTEGTEIIKLIKE